MAASAFQAVDLDQKYGGEPVQVRITMGKEPRHFMAIFKGKMVIFEVRRLTVFIIISSEISFLFISIWQVYTVVIIVPNIFFCQGGTSRKESSEPEPPIRLFQVHGSDPSNTKTIEVPALAPSLNSNDVFLLKSQSGIYLWCGKVESLVLKLNSIESAVIIT